MNFAMLWINLLDKNGQTSPKEDSDQDPHKHHTIPGDVFTNHSEDLFVKMRTLTEKHYKCL